VLTTPAQHAARAAYSTLLWLATPIYLARLWWRGRKEPAYRQHWPERLGHTAAGVGTGRLWVHAVSLGETLAAAALVKALREQEPGLPLLLTHSTATGREAGKKLLRDGDTQAWLPYDTPGAVRRFLRAHQPRVGVLMETEVWPNLLFAARDAGVPMVLANARLSARSESKGQALRGLMQPAAATFRRVLAQTEADAARLRSLGPGDVVVMGNLKFDITPSAELLAQGQRWRLALARPVVLAAVTREGEEALLLTPWRRHAASTTSSASPTSHASTASPATAAIACMSRPLLLIVPRHPQRFDEVAALARDAGFKVVRRSAWAETPPASLADADVCIGDSLGEMPLYYAWADVALLGGSFAPLGGQNLIEAAACGCPLLMGPHTFNFAQAAELALAAGAAERVPDTEHAVTRALALLADPGLAAWGARATHFAGQHRGAAQQMAAAILAVAAGGAAHQKP
jgi:3-deoxy-D-manno-octulosonic-acid transferase